MPNRILKEAIRTSPSVDALSPDEEVFWYRLITLLDDFGRYDGRPAVLRAMLYPLRLDSVSEPQVEAWRDRLVGVGMLRLYSVDGSPYIEAISWREHQPTRAVKSRWPASDGQGSLLLADESNGKQPLADVPVFGIRSSYSNSYSSDTAGKRRRDEVFEAIVEVCGYELESLTRRARGRVNDAAKDLRGVGAEPDDIRAFATFWRLHHPEADLTPQTISGNWPRFKSGELMTVRQARR